MGSTLVARHAGMTMAQKATTARSAGTAKNVATSVALTPNNRLAMTRVRAAAPINPATMPINGELHSLTDDQGKDVFASRAQGDQDSDIVRALRDQIGHHAVKADRGQQQREGREGAQHRAGEALAGQRIVQAVLHGANAIDDGGRIDGMNFAGDGGGESRVAETGTSHQEHAAVRTLLQGKIGCDLAVGIQTVLLHHSDHADDGDGLFGIEPEMFSDGVVVRPESLRELLVDDGDLRRVEVVLIGEEAARRPEESASSGNSWCWRYV